MDFWADGERKSNAKDSETSPEEEIKTLEGLGVVVVTFRSGLLHVWDLVDFVCLSGDVSTVNQVWLNKNSSAKMAKLRKKGF